MNNRPPKSTRLGFYLTPLHECSYFPDRQARTVFADPRARPGNGAQSTLTANGFRRSGRFFYQPRCPDCQACIPARIVVPSFAPDRSQRRVLRKNEDLQVYSSPAAFSREHYTLYNRYQQARHPDGSMLASSPEHYMDFLTSPWSNTWFHEFRLKSDGTLLAVSVVDHYEDAFSAVYTFFEPESPQRSLGTYAILWQIAEAQRLDLPWIYLGYWIAQSPKMRYKIRFQPLEIMRDGQWQALPPNELNSPDA